MSRASWRTIRSAYRCRTRDSSDRSLCSTGSGRSAFDAICHSEAITDSSPRLRRDHPALDEDVVTQVDEPLPRLERVLAHLGER